MATSSQRRTQPNGLAIDASGGPVIDPTENVKALMEASIKSLTREAELQALLNDEKIKRMEREWIHQEKMANQRSEFDKEIRRMESDRIDKIRSVDVSNAAATATQLLAAVNNYAAAQERTAQTLRDQVSSTAQAASVAQAALINPLADRVATLEKSSYTGAGKQQVSDPQIEKMSALVEKLVTSQAVGTGKSEGLSMGAALLLGALTVIGSVLGIAGMLYALLKS